MPAALERCVKHLMDKGRDKDVAWRICRHSMGTDAQIKARQKKRN